MASIGFHFFTVVVAIVLLLLLVVFAINISQSGLMGPLGSLNWSTSQANSRAIYNYFAASRERYRLKAAKAT